MKILKIILLLLLLLIGLFFLMGLISPTVNYGHTITVDKSVEEAWAVSQDQSKYAKWLKGYKSMELLTGELAQPGSTYKVVVDPGSGEQDFVMIETLHSIVENEKVHMTFDSDFMDFDQKIHFTEKEGKTTISSDSQATGKGLVMRSMFSVMDLLTGSFQKQEEENFDNLRDLINNNTTNYQAVSEEIMEEKELQEVVQ